MRLGITTPIVSLNPKGHGAWERSAGPDELAAIAESADRLGFHHLSCSEHVAVPTANEAKRGATYWDPLATLSFLAARTTSIQLATHVIVLGYHHPAAIVKRYSTLDRLSAGRVVLGVGVGSLEAEFELLGADFADRGRRADESIADIRRMWGQRVTDGFVLSPVSDRPAVPIWVGGTTRLSLRRAAAVGNGWAPFAMADDAIAGALAAIERPDEFDVALWAYGIDPMDNPEQIVERLGRLGELGATIVNVRFMAQSVEHWLDQAEAMAELPLP
jgi:probable F420-dependent oxidoreductase